MLKLLGASSFSSASVSACPPLAPTWTHNAAFGLWRGRKRNDSGSETILACGSAEKGSDTPVRLTSCVSFAVRKPSRAAQIFGVGPDGHGSTKVPERKNRGR